MKATAVGLLVLSAYWIKQGVGLLQQDPTQGVLWLVLGLLLLPLAKYVWGKNLGGSKSSQ